MSQTCLPLEIFRPRNPTLLEAGTVLRAKHDHIAVEERVFMVFDATIRPAGRVGLEPGAGLKRFTVCGQPERGMRGMVYAARAVVLQ